MILINSSSKDALKIFQPFLPIYVPVGIGFLLGSLERENIHARHIDQQIEKDVFALIAKYVKKMEKPYIFGFSVMTAAYRSSIIVSKKLKKLYPDSIICFGGIHASAIPEEVLINKHIDAVIRGEGELILPEFYRRVKEGNNFDDLNNISFRKDGIVIHNQREIANKNLDSLPPFPYHLFTSPKYDLGFVVSSRGCPYKCIFCSNIIATGKSYKCRSESIIVDELDLLYHKYGKTFVLFLDDNFLVSKERIYNLIDKIKKRGLHKKMTFSFQARGDTADYKLFKDLYNCGFRSVFFGMETASNRIMKFIKKGETVEQCVSGARIAKQVGFHVSAAFIYGFPGETHKDRMDCVEISKNLELDMVRFNNATPYPGTRLYDIARNEGRLNIQGLYENFFSVSTFIENPFKKIPFSYVPIGSTEKEIRNDILLSYLSFYTDIKKIKRIFSNPNEGVGWFYAGEKFLEMLKKLPALILLAALLSVKFMQLIIDVFVKKNTHISYAEFMQIITFGQHIKKNSSLNLR